LKTFNVCLANPPYSISQWDRAAFESDKYGRNFLGVPPQSRADYAFIQHILKSLDSKTGRCAILLPHGILFRNEEKHIGDICSECGFSDFSYFSAAFKRIYGVTPTRFRELLASEPEKISFEKTGITDEPPVARNAL
jgi:hypothetical protein